MTGENHVPSSPTWDGGSGCLNRRKPRPQGDWFPGQDKAKPGRPQACWDASASPRGRANDVPSRLASGRRRSRQRVQAGRRGRGSSSQGRADRTVRAGSAHGYRPLDAHPDLLTPLDGVSPFPPTDVRCQVNGAFCFPIWQGEQDMEIDSMWWPRVTLPVTLAVSSPGGRPHQHLVCGEMGLAPCSGDGVPSWPRAQGQSGSVCTQSLSCWAEGRLGNPKALV